MAKQITQRTLAGYRDVPVNAHYFDDLINMMKNKPRQFVDRILKPSYWKQEGVKAMKFDAVVAIRRIRLWTVVVKQVQLQCITILSNKQRN